MDWMLFVIFLTACFAAGTTGAVDTWAGFAFVPYLIWVSIASALNFSVWRRNPDVAPFDPSKA